jgi:hypothetical protein
MLQSAQLTLNPLIRSWQLTRQVGEARTRLEFSKIQHGMIVSFGCLRFDPPDCQHLKYRHPFTEEEEAAIIGATAARVAKSPWEAIQKTTRYFG